MRETLAAPELSGASDNDVPANRGAVIFTTRRANHVAHLGGHERSFRGL
jgi:hypothetical protein